MNGESGYRCTVFCPAGGGHKEKRKENKNFFGKKHKQTPPDMMPVWVAGLCCSLSVVDQCAWVKWPIEYAGKGLESVTHTAQFNPAHPLPKSISLRKTAW
ncbi:MAG: hypothetical protein N0E48_00985 [Candidatus Thiodiazotropha endolucinida]|nr:hypothetical protein [Candidatus Thiodiazotropha endolucinida]